MPQGPIPIATAITPTKSYAPMNLDANGNLLVAVAAESPDAGALVTQVTGTITAGTGTLELALAANPNRLPGGAIYNHSTVDVMGVYFGPHTVAGAAAAIIPIPANSVLYFGSVFGSDGVYQGEVAIEGTTLDVFSVLEVHK